MMMLGTNLVYLRRKDNRFMSKHILVQDDLDIQVTVFRALSVKEGEAIWE